MVRKSTTRRQGKPSTQRWKPSPVGLSNKFSSLMDVEEGAPLQKNQQQLHARRPPPITIPNMVASGVKAQLCAAGVLEYSIKNKSVGVSVHTTTKEDYDKVMKSLKSSKTGFFSHPGKEDKLQKFLLSGLCRMPIEDLQMELSAVNIKPEQILEITPRNMRYTENILYLIQFKIGTINIQDLQKIRVIDHQIVRWEKYQSRRSGPTQCRNCQMYGHGTTYCHLPSNCLKCGGKHTTTSCNEAPEAIKKCANCGKNHEANSKDCEARLHYLAVKNSINHNNVKKSNAQSKPQFVPAPPRPALNQGWSQTVKGNPPSPQQQQFHQQQHTAQSNSQNQQPTEELLSSEECFKILIDMTAALKSCRTRSEQIQALSKLAINYAFK